MTKIFEVKEQPKSSYSGTGKHRIDMSVNPNWRPQKDSKWQHHQFICYDGEGFDINGSHEYTYLAAYDAKEYYEIRNDKGLTSLQSLRFLVETSSKFSHGINVIYGGSYDANMILRDVPIEQLQILHSGEFINWKGFRIKYVSRKYFQVSATVVNKAGRNTRKRKSIRLWDVIGFFQQSFASACETWLGVVDKTITKGKKSRKSFSLDKIDFIITYCKKELYLFEQLCQRLWECLNRAGIKLNRWDGAGAASTALLLDYGVYQYKGSEEAQSQYYHLARAAYAGGRFELFLPGDYRCKVYNYDINSAYPYGMSQLPGFRGLEECKAKDHSMCKIGKFDLLRIQYEGSYEHTMHPYFHRDNDYSISYPLKTKGWHWSPEYSVAKKYGNGGKITHHFKYVSDSSTPFHWVPLLYNKRRSLKAAGDRAELALKLALNALYGKLVQQKGWKPGKPIPKSHQLYWGGWITALTRSMIYDAMMQAPEKIIATETDGIFSLVELDLPIGKGIGEWDVKIFDDFTYVQSGMYFGTLAEGYYDTDKPETKNIVRYRGLDQGTLKREHIIKGWEKFQNGGTAYYNGISTRFRTIGTSLVGERFKDWRQWRPDKKKIALLPSGKRLHDPTCTNHWGLDGHHTTISIQPKSQESVPYNVLWEDTEDKEWLFGIFEEEYEGLVRDA